MYYTMDRLSLYYEVYGDGEKSIVILPGWGDTRNTFNYLIDYFKDTYKIYILDYPGFGNSSFPDNDLDIFDYGSMIVSFFNDLEINNPIIISHSFGGRLSILLSGYYNIEIDKMVLIDAAGIKPKRKLKQIFRTYLYKFLKKLKIFLPRIKKERYIQKLLKIFGSTDYNSLPPVMMTTFRNVVNMDLKQYLKNIKSEVLLIWGKLDDDTPLKDGLLMNEMIEDSAIIVFPNCSHYSYLQNPVMTNKIIEEFIKE